MTAACRVIVAARLAAAGNRMSAAGPPRAAISTVKTTLAKTTSTVVSHVVIPERDGHRIGNLRAIGAAGRRLVRARASVARPTATSGMAIRASRVAIMAGSRTKGFLGKATSVVSAASRVRATTASDSGKAPAVRTVASPVRAAGIRAPGPRTRLTTARPSDAATLAKVPAARISRARVMAVKATAAEGPRVRATAVTVPARALRVVAFPGEDRRAISDRTTASKSSYRIV